MELKRNKNGAFVLASKSHVRAAFDRLDQIDARTEKLDDIIAKKCKKETTELDKLAEEHADLTVAINAFVLDKGIDYEDNAVKLTRVQAYRRKWDVKKLESILPRGIFKNVTKTEADPAKIDEYVRKGKIDAKLIEPAFDETPNAPFVKWTVKSDSAGIGEVEATGLAAKLA